MAFKRGPVIPGSELYEATRLAPQLTAVLTTADAGGAAVLASFFNLTAVDQPLPVDYRIFFARGDKAFTGNLTITPIINGTAQPGMALAVGAQGAAWETSKNVTPGTAAIGHGDTHGWKVAADGAFTCVGVLSIIVDFFGATTIQPDYLAWVPT